MQKLKPLSSLFQTPNKALRDLSERLEARSEVLVLVRRALPETLAAQVISAGIERGRLSIGVSGAVWASRLRYSTVALRESLSLALSVDIMSVRIRIVPPAPV